MTTFAVTVTYGNRFHLFKQVCESALNEGVAKVIVVDNNSASESKEQLKSYEQELGSDKIKVLYLDDNILFKNTPIILKELWKHLQTIVFTRRLYRKKLYIFKSKYSHRIYQSQ